MDVHMQTASQWLNFNAWLLWNLDRNIRVGGEGNWNEKFALTLWWLWR